MNILVDYQKLWNEGGYGQDNRLDYSLKFIQKEADKRGISKEIVDLAIMEIFLRVSMGHQYSLTKCPCGCGIDKSGTAITHAMLKRVLELDAQESIKRKKAFESQVNKIIVKYVTEKNRQYTDSKLRPNLFVRLFRKSKIALKWFFID